MRKKVLSVAIVVGTALVCSACGSANEGAAVSVTEDAIVDDIEEENLDASDEYVADEEYVDDESYVDDEEYVDEDDSYESDSINGVVKFMPDGEIYYTWWPNITNVTATMPVDSRFAFIKDYSDDPDKYMHHIVYLGECPSGDFESDFENDTFVLCARIDLSGLQSPDFLSENGFSSLEDFAINIETADISEGGLDDYNEFVANGPIEEYDDEWERTITITYEKDTIDGCDALVYKKVLIYDAFNQDDTVMKLEDTWNKYKIDMVLDNGTHIDMSVYNDLWYDYAMDMIHQIKFGTR